MPSTRSSPGEQAPAALADAPTGSGRGGRSPVLALLALVAATALLVALARPGAEEPPDPSAARAALTSPEGALLLAPDGQVREPVTLGYNSEGVTTGALPYDGGLVSDAVDALAPGVLRWPGGTLASYWDWRAGTVVPPGGANPPGWVERSGQRLAGLPGGQTLEALAAARDRADEPFDVVFVLNVLTSTDGERLRFRDGVLDDGLGDQLAMLRAAQEAGIPVRRVELGNEPWAGGPGEDGPSDYEEVFGGPDDAPRLYARVARVWAQAVAGEFPDARVAVAGAPRTTPFSRPEQWNGPLLDAVADEPAVDAVTFHVYAHPRLARDAVPTAETFADVADATDSRLAVLAEQEVGDVRRRAPRLDVWVTESGLFDESGARTHGTWTSGLVDAQLALAFPRLGVGVTVVHTLVGEGIFGAVYSGSEGLAFGGRFQGARSPEPTVTGGLTAKGVTLSLLGRVREGRPAVQPLVATAPSAADGDALGAAPTLPDGAPAVRAEMACPTAQDVEGGDGCAAFLLNLGDAPVRVAVPAGLAGDGQSGPAVEGVSGDPAAYVTGTPADSARLAPVAGGEPDGTVLLPPFSAAAVGL